MLVDAVARRAEGAAPVDPAVRAVVARAGAGPVAVAELAHRVGLSERQLRRRFLEHVGYGPRTLHRVLRLQRLLDRAIAAPDEGLAALAAHAGYADQAHLAREARALAGTTAAALVAGRRPARTSETSKTRTSRRARMAP
nr:helix-turn-helix domain-containing protein [Patulibacter sp. SYSU D01012]